MTISIRPAAVAGTFYPASGTILRPMLETYLDAANPDLSETRVRAVIVPHAGYIYSGPIAAFGYKLWARQPTPRRIYLLGPAHRVWFPGVALGDYDSFDTPLGPVSVDREQLRVLQAANAVFTILPRAHEGEHCLEVQLPFLQTLGVSAPIVPLLFGEVDPAFVGAQLAPLITPEDWIIVSSDLSHYHSYESARARDHAFLNYLLQGDQTRVSQGEACGKAPIQTLMVIAEHQHWHPHQLDYRNSGDTAGDRRQVVGYAAISYTEA